MSTTLPPEIELRVSPGLVPYREALAEMEARSRAIAAGEARELIWLLEHPPVYTAGTSAAGDELLDPRFEVVEAGRGGRYTYHGPGQRIGYVLLDLSARGRDVRNFVHSLEGWVIAALADLGLESWRAPGRIGIWTRDVGGAEAKIGAIGVRVRRWVTMHGFSVNLAPDLAHFEGIVPCGIADFGVTSLARLGKEATPERFDAALLARASDFIAALKALRGPRMKYRFTVTIAALLLAGCGGAEKGAEGERKSAAGDVLGGSISDAMLPLDSVTSQSPPLRETPASDSTASASGKPPRAAPAAEAEAASAPSPAPAD